MVTKRHEKRKILHQQNHILKVCIESFQNPVLECLYEAPKALAAERPLSKTNKDRDHFEYFLAFLKRFQIIVSCDCKNYKSGLVRATLRHDLPPQFLLLFRSKFEKREGKFIQKQRKVHRNSERYCDFSWTTMYKCAIQLHVCFRLNHAVEILFQKTCGKYTEKSQNMPSFSPFNNVWENLQKGSTRRRPFVLSVKKMWENA